jgi:hypothetical protein
MTPSPFNLLADVEEPTIPRETTRTLKEQASTPASEAFVLEVQRQCPIRAWARRMTVFFAFALGTIFAAQVGGYFALRAAFHEATRSAVLDVLKEHKLITAIESVRQFVAVRAQ